MNNDDISSHPAADSSPYPEITAVKKNKALSDMLMPLFTGKSSELTESERYMMYSIVFKESYPQYAKLFRAAALTEAHHMELLGEMILALGGEPMICGCDAEFSYTDDIASALIASVNAEQRTYAAYITAARRAGDRLVFSLLSRIALDEMLHAGLMRTALSRLRNIRT